MRLARTTWVPIHAHARTVFMEMVVNASLLTNAEMVVINVMIMLFVVTLKGDTAAPVKQDMREMVGTAQVSSL